MVRIGGDATEGSHVDGWAGTALVVTGVIGPLGVAVRLGAILIRNNADIRATVRRRRVPLTVGGLALLVTALIIPVGFVAAGILAFKVRGQAALKVGAAVLFAGVGMLGFREERLYCEQESGCIAVGIPMLWIPLMMLALVVLAGAIARPGQERSGT